MQSLTNTKYKLLLKLMTKTFLKSVNMEEYSRLHSALKYSYRMVPVIIVSYFIHPSLQIVTFHLTLKISEVGMLKTNFTTEETESEYFIARNE